MWIPYFVEMKAGFNSKYQIDGPFNMDFNIYCQIKKHIAFRNVMN